MNGYKISQPDFWLEIKKEYIIENFEKLLLYIRRYQYDGKKESGEGEFVKTCRYLVDLAYELSEYSLTSSFVTNKKFKLKNSETEISDTLAYRIMVAALIVSQKIDEDEQKLLMRLINLLVISHKMPQTDIADDLIEVVVNCVCNAPIQTLGVKWDDIENETSVTPIRLLYNLSRTKFETDKGFDCVYEGKGSVFFTKGTILSAPINKADMLKATANMTKYISIGRTINLLLLKSDHMKTPECVDDVAEGMTFMTRAQSGIKTNIIETKRKYSSGTVIPVMVRSNYGVKIEAETIDPEYEKVYGKVGINLNEIIRYSDIFKVLTYFTPGTILLVEFTPDDKEFTFTLRTAFTRFYQEYADDMRGEQLMGVYVQDYSAGTQWLTEPGFLVNVMGKPTDEAVLEAMDNNIPLKIRINSTKMQFGNVLINGSIVNDFNIDLYGLPDPIPGDIESYKNERFVELFKEYLEYCKDILPESTDCIRINETDEEGVKTISNILMEHQNMLSETMSRLTCLQVSLMYSISR